MRSKKSIADLKYLSHKLDSQFRLPFGFRIGWDGLLGLIPGFGDLITTLFAFYILFRAAMLGCPLPLIFRMGINILVENLVDVVPIFGNLFDFVWKANRSNVEIIESYLEQPRKATWLSRIYVFLFLFLLLALVVGLFVLAILVASRLWEFIFQPRY